MLCGASLSIIHEGGVKNIMKLLSTAVLTIAILSPIKDLDLDSYALESARIKELEDELLSGSHEAEEKLNRLYIQQEYNEYIKNEAAQLGIINPEISVLAQWNLEGLWVPYSVQIYADCDKSKADELGRIIRDELGIPYERQLWFDER